MVAWGLTTPVREASASGRRARPLRAAAKGATRRRVEQTGGGFYSEAMSTTTTEGENPSDGETADEPQVEKEVTVRAYARPDEAFHARGKSNKRDFLSTAVPSQDWFETTTSTTTNYYIVLGDEDDPESQYRLQVNRSEYNELAEEIASGAVETANVVRTEKKEETDRSHKLGTYNAGKHFLFDVLQEHLPDEFAVSIGGEQQVLTLSTGYSHIEYTDDDGNAVVTLNAGTARDRILTHQSERSEDNRYENNDDLRAMQVTLTIEAPEAVADGISEDMTTRLHEMMTNLSWVYKVRVASCTVSREGDCFV